MNAGELRRAAKLRHLDRFSAEHDASVFMHLISPPEFSTRPTAVMVEAFRVEIATFLRCGGTITLREWCLMPEVLRRAAMEAVGVAAHDPAREALDRMEAALPR